MIKRAFQAGEVHSVFDLLLQEVYRVDTDLSATVIRFGIIPDRTAIFLTFCPAWKRISRPTTWNVFAKGKFSGWKPKEYDLDRI